MGAECQWRIIWYNSASQPWAMGIRLLDASHRRDFWARFTETHSIGMEIHLKAITKRVLPHSIDLFECNVISSCVGQERALQSPLNDGIYHTNSIRWRTPRISVELGCPWATVYRTITCNSWRSQYSTSRETRASSQQSHRLLTQFIAHRFPRNVSRSTYGRQFDREQIVSIVSLNEIASMICIFLKSPTVSSRDMRRDFIGIGMRARQNSL